MKRHHSHARTLLAALLLLSAFVAPAGAEDKKDDDWMKGRLFAPELLLQHRADLSLSDAQRDTLRREIVAVQSKVPEIDYEMLDRAAAVQGLIERRPIDAKAVMAEVEKLLAAENRKKLLYLEMLIDLRNMLTPAQIEAARELALKKP